MPFATEQDIRNEGWLQDYEKVPSDQLLECLTKAHDEILQETILTDQTQPTAEVVRAEALLSLAGFLYAAAVSTSIHKSDWHTTSIQMNAREKAKELMDLSQSLREEAWALLQPYTKTSVVSCLQVTRSET